MRIRSCVLALAAVAGLASSARAQQLTVADSAPVSVDTAMAHVAVASSMDRPSDAVRRDAPAPEIGMAAQTAGLGQAKAMMVVGGAAFVVGALIGGDVGTVFMVGGAGVGLYGLWKYLQ